MLMRLNPYLNFNGDCEAAFNFYEQVLKGKILFKMTWGESPMAEQLPPEKRNSIMHTTLSLGDMVLMGADTIPGTYQKPAGIYVSLSLSDVAEARRIFDALKENGTVQMEFQKTFWAEGFGVCVDRFGTPWMVNCE
jgi:PhnB protein